MSTGLSTDEYPALMHDARRSSSTGTHDACSLFVARPRPPLALLAACGGDDGGDASGDAGGSGDAGVATTADATVAVTDAAPG
ncbi:MAG: hypothetical protein R2713_22580 [Ilumatobacteraceae bacterium]